MSLHVNRKESSILTHCEMSAGEGELVAVPVPADSAPKGMSASEEGAEAGEPAGSQVQSGERGSLLRCKF